MTFAPNGIAFFARANAEVDHQGFTVLKNFPEPLRITKYVLQMIRFLPGILKEVQMDQFFYFVQ